ncbi:HotDog domain-containing protein [Nemania abortiva]|nr:HotDog domain-containing protein [Nemania abortiva]
MSTEAQQSASLETHERYFKSRGISILQAPSIVTFLPSSREGPNPAKTPVFSRDTLFRYLLDNERAIPHLIGFHEDPFLGSSLTFPDLPFIIKSVSLVLELNDGLHGFNGTVHGGMLCSIMDEAMGSIFTQNDILNREAKAKGLIPADSGEITANATASMDVRFLRPLPTPKVVLVTASLDRVEGRRLSLHVRVTDKDGKEYATCNGSFVTLSKAKI